MEGQSIDVKMTQMTFRFVEMTQMTFRFVEMTRMTFRFVEMTSRFVYFVKKLSMQNLDGGAQVRFLILFGNLLAIVAITVTNHQNRR